MTGASGPPGASGGPLDLRQTKAKPWEMRSRNPCSALGGPPASQTRAWGRNAGGLGGGQDLGGRLLFKMKHGVWGWGQHPCCRAREFLAAPPPARRRAAAKAAAAAAAADVPAAAAEDDEGAAAAGREEALLRARSLKPSMPAIHSVSHAFVHEFIHSAALEV